MARDRDRDRDRRRTPKDSGRRIKKKVCIFCKEHIEWVDYKDVNLLRRYMSDRGKIRARRVSGNCSQHQRDVAIAIKTARELALLPYTQRAVNERGPGRGGRPPREGGGGGGRGGYGGPAAAAGPADAVAADIDVPDDAFDDEADDVVVGAEDAE
jgi:small subunit ribosomal protein S18